MKIEEMDDARLIDEGHRCDTLKRLRACWRELVKRFCADQPQPGKIWDSGGPSLDKIVDGDK